MASDSWLRWATRLRMIPGEQPATVRAVRAGRRLIADGVQACYRDVGGAQSALRSGAVPIVLGALAFDVDSPAALMAPRSSMEDT